MSILSRTVDVVRGIQAIASTVRADTDDARGPGSDMVSRVDSGAETIVSELSGMGGQTDKGASTKINTKERKMEPLESRALAMRDSVSRRIVTELPRDCTRRGWEWSEDGDAIEDVTQRLGLAKAMRAAHTRARLFGGAAVILGIDDNRKMDEPVAGSVNDIAFARVVDVRRIYTIDSEWEDDYRSPHYDQPRVYRITPRGRGSNEESRIHADRLLIFRGNEAWLDEEWWGRSVLEVAETKLLRLLVIGGAIQHLVQEFKVSVFRIAGLHSVMKDAQSGGTPGKLRARMQAINAGKSIINGIMLDADKEDFSHSAVPVQGLSDLWDRAAFEVAAAAGMPLTRLFGQSPSGLSSNNETGEKQWREDVAAAQEDIYAPHLRRVATMLGYPAAAPVFAPLDEPTHLEKAEANLKRAQAEAFLIDRGVLSPQSVAETWSEGYEVLDDAPLELPNDEGE